MTSAKFSDFLTPSPLVRIFTQPPLLNSLTSFAFPGPPLSVDLIYGSPLAENSTQRVLAGFTQPHRGKFAPLSAVRFHSSTFHHQFHNMCINHADVLSYFSGNLEPDQLLYPFMLPKSIICQVSRWKHAERERGGEREDRENVGKFRVPAPSLPALHASVEN